jgi:hypothetical protein
MTVYGTPGQPANEPSTHKVGDRLYFLPGERKNGYAVPAGEVDVIRVIDHIEPTPYAPRFSYVVQVPGIAAATQGTDDSELYVIGEVPVDMRFEWTYIKTTCHVCRQQVTYANTKMRREEILRDGPTYPGMATHKEYRVCASC